MKLTITTRFVTLQTVVVAIIFLLFNTFVYLEFMNVTIENEKQIVLSRLSDVVRHIDGKTQAQAIADVRRIVPDPRQMVRLLSPSGAVVTASDAYFLPGWVPKGLGYTTDLGHGVLLFQYENQRILMASAVLQLRGGKMTLEWLENVASLDHSIAFVFYLLLTGSIGGLALAAVASYFLARYSLLPIREMIATARAITPGDLSSRIEVPKRKDELTELAHTYNAMLDRIFRAFSRERQFVADASHELRTPLSVLEGYVHLLRRWGWEDKAVRQEAVTAIEEEIHHLREMTNQLLALAAIDREALEETGVVSASEIALRVAQKWKRLYPGYKWTVALDHASATRVRISEVRLEQVFRALLDNARKYTQPEGAIRIEVAHRGEIVSIVIQDSGEGIPAEDLPHVTERFYRADKARSRQEGGIGLGLAICREIVERFRGRLIITSSGEDGTRVEVVLPGVEGEGEGESEG